VRSTTRPRGKFYAGGGGEVEWTPTLADAQPLFEWPYTVGGITLTYMRAQARFIMAVNLPSDHDAPEGRLGRRLHARGTRDNGALLPHQLHAEPRPANVLSADLDPSCGVGLASRPGALLKRQLGCETGIQPTRGALWPRDDGVYAGGGCCQSSQLTRYAMQWWKQFAMARAAYTGTLLVQPELPVQCHCHVCQRAVLEI